jgi:SAM-dependent methyltransferase
VEKPNKPAPTSICPRCRSSERHRLAKVVLEPVIGPTTDRIIHFAPERPVEKWLRAIGKEYVSADLHSSRAMHQADLTHLPYEDGSFSLVWCSHVLEHIEADHLAMGEIYRVLSPGGAAVIMVPVYGDRTYEDASITTPEERLIHFKQRDHVRLYGRDIVDRLSGTGFQVEIHTVAQVRQSLVEEMRLDYPSTREVYWCLKPR